MAYINDNSIEDRFLAKVRKDKKTGCWIWVASRVAAGYGQFRVGQKNVLAHRWAYSHFKGKIAEKLVVDHKCRRRLCVNPDHLEAVTVEENTRRGQSLPNETAVAYSEKRRERRRKRSERIDRHVTAFFKQVEVITGGCWLWCGKINPDGYGVFLGKRRAHRWAYERFVGQISDGMNVDHKCRVRNCVNPQHLEVVTSKENTLRGEGITAQNARKTHCKRGHELSGDNLYEYKGKRCCKTCRSEHSLKVKQKIDASPELQEKVRAYHRQKKRESNGRLGVKQGIPNKDKTHCPQGHEYTPESTILDKGQRRCRTCRKEQQKQAYLKRKSKLQQE